MTPRSGRYVPATGSASRLVLRLERLAGPTAAGDAWIVSGDLRKRGANHAFLSVARRRRRPAVHFDAASGTLTAELRFGDRAHARGPRGSLRIDFATTRTGRVRIQCPARDLALDESIAIRWLDRYYRDLSIELDKIRDASFPGSTQQRGERFDLGGVFRKAGFRTRIVKSHRKLDDEPDGWSAGELHQAMERNRRDLSDTWGSYVFLTSLLVDEAGEIEHDTLGWMFDAAYDDRNDVPREGCAVFDTALRAWTRETFGRSKNIYQRELILTIAHELGHAMNLTHSFQKGRANSPSIMNYPDHYRHGLEAYYEDQTFSFDRPELTHLRHHSALLTQPGAEGGADFEFGAFKRFPDGLPEARDAVLLHSARVAPELLLELAVSSSRLLLGEPLGVCVRLRKHSGGARLRSIQIDTQLSWETDRLKFALRPGGAREWQIVDAPLRKCQRPRRLRVAAGRAGPELTTELVMSRRGEIFDREGDYELCAVLDLHYRGRRAVLRSPAVAICVEAPRTPEQRRLSRLLRSPGLRRLLLLPGSEVADSARAAADELERRAPHSFGGELSALALMREAQSYERGRTSQAARRFQDRERVAGRCHEIHARSHFGRFFARHLRGIERTARRLV